MRDARINLIGEGANDVLRAFVAVVGMRDVGLELQGILQAMKRPLKNLGRLGSFAGHRLESLFRPPEVRTHQAELQPDADRLGRLVAHFAANVERLLRRYREEIVDREYLLGRIGDCLIDLYVGSCVLRRLESLLAHAHDGNGSLRSDLITGRYFLRTADRRVRANLAALWDNDDRATTEAADLMLKGMRLEN